VVSGIIAVIGLVFNKKIRKLIESGILWLTDKQVGISAIYIKKYNDPPIKDFDNDIFNTLISEIKSDKITKVAVNPKFIRIRSQKLGMKLGISLEDESEVLSEDMPELESYNVIIRMDAEIKGVRHIDRLEDFTTIADTIHNIIRTKCFPNQNVRQSYVLCDVDRIDKHRHDKIKDLNLESEITFSDNNMKIMSKAPQSLRKTVKKYVYA
jgi:hypothetical protein